jgi:hypothetical protein
LENILEFAPGPLEMLRRTTNKTGWILDHLLLHAEKVKVAHLVMPQVIAVAKN